MVIVNSYGLAVFLCFIIMLCWGSWGNTQKLAAKSWRYELFYWDYVIGMVIFALLLALTLGSFGHDGEPFFKNIAHVSLANWGWIIIGGIIFNASNILLSASTSIAGLSVAFPLGVGIALVLGVVNNYIVNHTGNPALLAIGVALVVIAIICNGVASGKKGESGISKADQKKGIILAVCAVLLSIEMRGDSGPTSHHQKSLRDTIPFDPETQIPIIRASICTGERVAGFKNRSDGHFTEVMLIRTAADERTFMETYGIDSLNTEY